MRALSVLCATLVAAAGAHADERKAIYVDEVHADDKALAADAAALTTALCAAIGKDKRVDVLCAPDVKQMLNFAATAALVGSNKTTSTSIEERLNRTEQVVSATLKHDGKKLVLAVKAGPKAAESQATALFTSKPLISLEEKQDKARVFVDTLPAIASRIVAALFPSTDAPPPPPPPVEAKKEKPAPAGGW